MADSRPDPDSLLELARLEEDRRGRGNLKVFLGAAPGVGKTYAMLEEARKLSGQGVDVAVGYVEPHVRPETAALVLGLDIIPAREIEYHGIKLRELDLDAALHRKPSVLLVDELAHSNPPGSTHLKRWQDIEDLLQAGISVFTTLNIQHVESLKDVISKITRVSVRETVPDSFLDQAHEVELVDIAPDELLGRLRDGKVYVPKEAGRAMENFFRRENLTALRELALRRTAERVSAELEDYRKSHVESPVWPTGDRLLVCIGPSPFSAQLVRATRRMAAGLKAPWLAVHVETPASARMSQAARDQLSQNLRLAEELGAEVVRLAGENVAGAVIDFARRRNATKIVVGKPLQPRWKEALVGSFVYELTRRCGEIDIYVISGDAVRPVRPEARIRPPWNPAAHAWALLAVAVSTAVSFAMYPFFELSNIIMVYLLGVVAVAARGERGPAALASVLSVLAFDVFFVPPRFSFAFSDVEYLFTFAVMLVAALLISGLTVRLRLQAEWARQRESATTALYAMSRTLAATYGLENIVQEAAQHLASVFETKVAVLLRDEQERLVLQDLGPLGYPLDEREMAVADWAFKHRQRAGLGTTTLPSASAIYQPLSASSGTVGVIGLRPSDEAGVPDPDRLHLLETFTNQMALAIERANLASRAKEVEMQVEVERLRNSLLSAVSHDLRTPLASIMGSSSTLLEKGSLLSPDTRRELTEAIYDEAERLNRIVGNLLDVTRLEAGAIVAKREWQPLEEILGIVLNRLSRSLLDHPLTTRIPADLPLVPIDATLIEQVLFNLVDNATRHTPPGTPIEISAVAGHREVIVSVADRGPGIPAGEAERIFEKFHRAPRESKVTGTGLGLTVARGIVAAHGGRIWVEGHPANGAVFRFTLPLVGAPPSIPSDHSIPAAEETTGKDLKSGV